MIQLTPSPIPAAERSLSKASVSANPSPTEHLEPVAGNSASSSPARLWTWITTHPAQVGLIAFWFILAAYGFLRMRWLYVAGVIGGATAGILILRWAMSDKGAAWLKDFFGPAEISSSVIRRGYFGEGARCRVCLADVHDIGEMCQAQKTGQCDICGPVLMDYYGCPRGKRDRNHRIVGDVHPTTEREWQRMRRALRLCERSSLTPSG